MASDTVEPMLDAPEIPRTPKKRRASPKKTEMNSRPIITSPSKSTGYTVADDMLIMTLRGQGMGWEEVSSYFLGRSATAVRLHHDKVLKNIKVEELANTAANTGDGSKGYTPDQDRLIVMLKETKQMKWAEMEKFFPGKSSTALRLHYSKLKKVMI